MKLTYRHTMLASELGYVTQAVVNNLAPLLFFTFQREFSISFEDIAVLISVNFGIQILVDLLSARFIDKIGYRGAAVLAHVMCVIGLVAMGILPYCIPGAYWGLMIAVGINAVGGGLIEVLVSPIVEALPGDRKAASMSLLHSFYCWGQVGVVLLSTLYFYTVGTQAWRFLPMLWAILPLCNLVLFCRVPICTLEEKESRAPVKNLLTSRLFWVMVLLMLCAGASELSMSQWSSLFAEAGLGVPKAVGDLLGPCSFALLMGIARTVYGRKGEMLNLKKTMAASAALCVISYLLTVFSPVPLLSLLGCALCGLSVGMMWPGVFSLSARYYPRGGTAMFALLALAGDLGCASGPGLVGTISNAVENARLTFTAGWFSGGSMEEVSLKTGLLIATLFPLIMLFAVILLRRKRDITMN